MKGLAEFNPSGNEMSACSACSAVIVVIGEWEP
jgi:hypothetical protein